MKKERNTYSLNSLQNSKVSRLSILAFILLAGLSSCDFIRMKNDTASVETERQLVARVSNATLYRDELKGIIPQGTLSQDSITRVETYIDSWIRKQLLIQEASKKIDINEAEVARKILDYRYSIIAYEYQSYYIKQHLDTVVAPSDVESYYKQNVDNFILKQNIVRATFIKVPKNAPNTKKLRDLIVSGRDKEKADLKSYCLSFSASYHISDSTWMVFDELVRNSPLAEIPNKIQFLRANPYYETSDDNYLYFLKVEEYRISDNISPLEFVKDDILNIILNKRKVELAQKLEDDVYNQAAQNKEFEIIRQ